MISLIEAPTSRLSKTTETWVRVSRKTHAPQCLPGMLSTAGHRDQSSVAIFLPSHRCFIPHLRGVTCRQPLQHGVDYEELGVLVPKLVQAAAQFFDHHVETAGELCQFVTPANRDPNRQTRGPTWRTPARRRRTGRSTRTVVTKNFMTTTTARVIRRLHTSGAEWSP
jgi:hypothetical protein